MMPTRVRKKVWGFKMFRNDKRKTQDSPDYGNAEVQCFDPVLKQISQLVFSPDKHYEASGWVNENGGIEYYYDGNIIGSHDTRWDHNKKTQTINTILDYTQNAGLYLGCNVGEKESSKFKGYISEIAVFDKKISHHEIYQIYKAPSEHKDLLSVHNNEGFSKMVYYNRLIKTLDGTNTGINNLITNNNPLILQSGTYQTVSTDLMNH